MGLFKPMKLAWMSDNEETALKAVEKEINQNKLEEIAKNAILFTVRKSAIFKLVKAYTELYYDSTDNEGYPVSRKKQMNSFRKICTLMQ